MADQQSEQFNEPVEDVETTEIQEPQAPDLSLPIPCPVYFDNYHTPLFPLLLPPVNCFADPIYQPLRFPQPMGILKANSFNIFGVGLHDFGYVNFNPHKYFVKYMLWFLEINDHLFHSICPSDLNDMPCEWDELQGGCQMLRLCEMRHKYPHPHLGEIPACTHELLSQCRYVHDIEPTCRSIARNLRKLKGEEPQLCEAIAKGEICPFGHDFESARVEAVYGYWEHRREARARGSIGYVKRDVFGRKLLRPIEPVER